MSRSAPVTLDDVRVLERRAFVQGRRAEELCCDGARAERGGHALERRQLLLTDEVLLGGHRARRGPRQSQLEDRVGRRGFGLELAAVRERDLARHVEPEPEPRRPAALLERPAERD